MGKLEGDIIEIDGKHYYLYVSGTHYWSTLLLRKNLKRDGRSDICSLSSEDVERGKIVKRGVLRSEL